MLVVVVVDEEELLDVRLRDEELGALVVGDLVVDVRDVEVCRRQLATVEVD